MYTPLSSVGIDPDVVLPIVRTDLDSLAAEEEEEGGDHWQPSAAAAAVLQTYNNANGGNVIRKQDPAWAGNYVRRPGTYIQSSE